MAEDWARKWSRRHAEMTIEEFKEIALDFSDESIAWMSNHLEQNKTILEKGYISRIGAYVVECILDQFYGEYVRNDIFGPGVVFKDGSAGFPYNEIAKRIDTKYEGRQSILELIKSIPDTFKKVSSPDTATGDT